MNYYVYILKSLSHDRYYVGQTDNLKVRLERHNNRLVQSTKPYNPWELVYYEIYSSRSLAMTREKEIKNKKSKKYIEYLIKNNQLNRQSPDGCPDSHRDYYRKSSPFTGARKRGSY